MLLRVRPAGFVGVWDLGMFRVWGLGNFGFRFLRASNIVKPPTQTLNQEGQGAIKQSIEHQFKKHSTRCTAVLFGSCTTDMGSFLN